MIKLIRYFSVPFLFITQPAMAEMDVGGTFNIYGNLFGWTTYDSIFDFIVGTGIWVIPFIILIYQAMTARDEGNKYDPVSALISIELRAYIAIILVLVFLVPSVNVSKLIFVYDDGTTKQVVGKSTTTFDKFDVGIPDQVRIPVGWYGILYASAGFTKVLKAVLPTGVHARQVLHELRQLTINDSDLQNKLANFDQACRKPALGLLSVVMTKYRDGGLAKKFTDLRTTVTGVIETQWKLTDIFRGTDQWKINPSYEGNQFFMDYLYQPAGTAIHLCTDTEDGNDPAVTCIPKAGFGPMPGCAEIWGDSTGGLMNELTDHYEGWGIENITNLINSDPDSFVHNRMTSRNKNVTERGIGDIKGGLGGAFQGLVEKIEAASVNIETPWLQMVNSLLRFYLPVIMGVITLFITALLPIFLVFGRYTVSAIMPLAITYFGIAFLPGIWHFAGWVDNVMLKIVYGGKGILDALTSLETAVVNIISLSVYAFFTFLWIKFLAELGGSAAHAIAQSSSSLDGTAGAAHQGRNVWNKGKSIKKSIEKRRDGK